jgi:hypothetical protein
LYSVGQNETSLFRPTDSPRLMTMEEAMPLILELYTKLILPDEGVIERSAMLNDKESIVSNLNFGRKLFSHFPSNFGLIFSTKFGHTFTLTLGQTLIQK